MQLIRWKPFREFFTLPERFDRLFEESLARMEENLPSWWMSRWPSTEIYQTDQEIVLKAELPGIDPKNMSIHVDHGRLRIECERKHEKQANEENYHRRELAYGKFSRTFTLPTSIDQGKINARYEKGILHITLPKKEEHREKEIKIKVE
ncbi:MAG: Hsp20/alpha crystallin family protein [Candidatus Aminicenantes bacterium]|nr:Hsp20/alpha crystallin family protein [Candidatus Aminicenantes bacterium]MDH5713964.1 Hsp20/alpha crystallin family protein [Candidatus Aminicenantes bacterium]